VSIREIEIEDLLPLPEATFHILMAVAEDDLEWAPRLRQLVKTLLTAR
jgi:hypothetical protein